MIKNMNINSRCFCNEDLNTINKIVMVLPCCHFIHENCINKLLLSNIKICYICKNEFTSVLVEEKIKLLKDQNAINLKSIKQDNCLNIDYKIFANSLLTLTSLVNKLLLINTNNEIMDLIEKLLNDFKIKINILDNTKNNPIIYKDSIIKWIKDNDKEITIIPNHSSYLDSIIIYYLFQCGFVGSSFLKSINIGKIIVDKCNILLFNRGEKTGMVNKIKKYLKKNKKICIFPEGMISYNNTLVKFRTGSFYASKNVCPIVIKYNVDVHDDNIINFIYKCMIQKEIIVDVYINDLINGPFNDDKIEKCRIKMSKIGNFELSNVSNKFVKD